jgi:hypothetical protein
MSSEELRSNEKLRLLIDLEAMGVPYEKPNDSNEPRLAYIDLKANPEKVSTLPELKKLPESEGLIRSINETDYYGTVGIGAWTRRVPEGIHFYSYLQFCFADRAVNENAMNYYYLFHQFALRFHRQETPEDLIVWFVVKRTDFNGDVQPIIGWSARVIINGLGRTDFEARYFPNKGYRLLVDFLVSQKFA